MKQQLKHNRNLDYYRRAGEREVETAQATPTNKQVRFVRKLFAICKENGVETSTGGSLRTRVDYAQTIDILIARLNAAGVDIRGNGKEAAYVFGIAPDRNGNYRGFARIEVRDAPASTLVRKFERLMVSEREEKA